MFLQENFDVYRKESIVDLKHYKETVDQLRKENSDYRVQVAKLNSQVDFLNGEFIEDIGVPSLLEKNRAPQTYD
jgi:hypothetical protein